MKDGKNKDRRGKPKEIAKCDRCHRPALCPLQTAECRLRQAEKQKPTTTEVHTKSIDIPLDKINQN